MMEKTLTENVLEAVKTLYGKEADPSKIQVQETRKDFRGDLTVVVFPLLRYSGKLPEQTAEELGEYIRENNAQIGNYNVIKGFLNLEISNAAILDTFNKLIKHDPGFTSADHSNDYTTLVEYSSPNTNKPLHLGHIRNNLLGYSLARILSTCGHKVYKTNIVNDRGIHICKTMLAWKLYGKGSTPAETGVKGDHFVGDYYVRFEKEYRKEINELKSQGLSQEEAAERSSLMSQARELLRKWETGDKETVDLWKRMNEWVYEGFDTTYNALGVDFDKIYFESETYKPGREIVRKGLDDGVFYKKDDGSVWVDLSSDGLDEKLLLRADGTAVYMTQDLGTAVLRYKDYTFDHQYYVVGNEQDYHFQVLKIILGKLGYEWSEGIHHFSYGMVNLPEGKMKSREGKVVDADELINTMLSTAADMSGELGKLNDYTGEEKKSVYRKIGLGALKYFILKVDPRKNMMFNPAESIDFNGNTGPFIQYSYARIKSVMRKAADMGLVPADDTDGIELNAKERSLVNILRAFDTLIISAADELNPAIIANYVYELSKEFNQFYHDFSILGEENNMVRMFRLALTEYTGKVIGKAMWLLGIDMPERM
ncbi:MAG: arginine--tRNA ligase [Bacteroidales bacterium]|nr:arginine--tRNA ligase [Bacteroidales bacterium]